VSTLLDDAATVVEAARGLLASADSVHAAVARAHAALERASYDCVAARRQRDRMAILAARAHQHGNAITDAGLALLRHAGL
jgi:hypothetical protein